MSKKCIITIREDIHDNYLNLKDLAELYKDYPDAWLDIDSGYDGHEVKVVYHREETNEEKKAREILEAVENAKIAEIAEKKKLTAKKEFDRLKKTYGFQ